jgi:hypothetical protein
MQNGSSRSKPLAASVVVVIRDNELFEHVCGRYNCGAGEAVTRFSIEKSEPDTHGVGGGAAKPRARHSHALGRTSGGDGHKRSAGKNRSVLQFEKETDALVLKSVQSLQAVQQVSKKDFALGTHGDEPYASFDGPGAHAFALVGAGGDRVPRARLLFGERPAVEENEHLESDGPRNEAVEGAAEGAQGHGGQGGGGKSREGQSAEGHRVARRGGEKAKESKSSGARASAGLSGGGERGGEGKFQTPEADKSGGGRLRGSASSGRSARIRKSAEATAEFLDFQASRKRVAAGDSRQHLGESFHHGQAWGNEGKRACVSGCRLEPGSATSTASGGSTRSAKSAGSGGSAQSMCISGGDPNSDESDLEL